MSDSLHLAFPEHSFAADFSKVDFPPDYIARMAQPADAALAHMAELEAGYIANPDEGRMVGHYWLRSPELAPTEEITNAIHATLGKIKTIATQVHSGELAAPAGPFTDLLVIGIGGSALGPQFVARALGHPQRDKLIPHFFDNTDPDGIDLTLATIGPRLATTLVLVVSKSGGTPETRNGMKEAEAAFDAADLHFSKQAIAITGQDSKLHQYATAQKWLDFLPMWDWVGGRTSETAAVGLLPAALQGIDIDSLLAGAAQMDALTRQPRHLQNPALLLALAWHHLTDAKGSRDMVILPYKDRLELFAKYLQQLVMESLGKEKDLDGNLVYQGIAVYGNKGSTDQHAYVQQLREGVPNFFATFIEVLQHREDTHTENPIVDEDGMTSGDYLHGFLLGTRDALHEKGRKSLTLSIDQITPHAIGLLIALFERAVGLYAHLVGINAYHQPGVEAGKKAAATVLAIRKQIKDHLARNSNVIFSAKSLSEAIGHPEKIDWAFKILQSLHSNQPDQFTRNPIDNHIQDEFQKVG